MMRGGCVDLTNYMMSFFFKKVYMDECGNYKNKIIFFLTRKTDEYIHVLYIKLHIYTWFKKDFYQ